MAIRFDDRVAIVTGAGVGLGRCHALGLAARGARVVVNDLGVSRDGTGASSEAALSVVEEIKAMGGEAMAHGADVSDEDAVKDMVAQAMDAWGRIDICVNNAGILMDKTFAKMEMAAFRKVVDVHLIGSANVAHACWPIMREQKYGRIVLTSSASGLYGNFGQSNYGAAKAAMLGLMNVLHMEGARDNIRVNTLAPTAATRMTADLLPDGGARAAGARDDHAGASLPRERGGAEPGDPWRGGGQLCRNAGLRDAGHHADGRGQHPRSRGRAHSPRSATRPTNNSWAMHSARPRNTPSTQQRPKA